jgi:site-specific DNA recombinase
VDGRRAAARVLGEDHKLVIVDSQVEIARMIFRRYAEFGSVRSLKQELHKSQSHPGEHTPIIDQLLWDAAQAQLAGYTADRNSGPRTRQPSLFTGICLIAMATE